MYELETEKWWWSTLHFIVGPDKYGFKNCLNELKGVLIRGVPLIRGFHRLEGPTD